MPNILMFAEVLDKDSFKGYKKICQDIYELKYLGNPSCSSGESDTLIPIS